MTDSQDYRKYLESKFGDIDTHFNELKERFDKMDEDMLEYRFFKKYPRIALGVLVLSIIVVLYVAIDTKSEMRDVKSYVEMKTAPMVLRGGTRTPPLLDSLARK
mgnify:CR=1 FL=1